MLQKQDNRQPNNDGNWLRSMRLRKGLHQHQLAAKMDINQGRISEWENGVKPIPPERLQQVQTFLN